MEVAIIGAGICGLTTAISLKAKGYNVTVYEKSPKPNEVGAGIWLQPNAIQAFEKLGILNAIKNHGSPLNKVDITNHKLNPIRKSAIEISRDTNWPQIIAIHRAKLQECLLEVLGYEHIKFGEGYVNHKVDAHQTRLETEKGYYFVDIIMACDGINSLVRRKLFGNITKRFSGQVCYRGVANYVLPDKLKDAGWEAWGNAGRFGFSQISATETYWFAVLNGVEGESFPKNKRKASLLRVYKKYDPLIIDLLENTLNDTILANDISDIKPFTPWFKDNVILLGDAAHATTPNMGQGACQAIEDAYYIGLFLKDRQSGATQFSKFEAFRRDKVDYVVETSWRIGKSSQNLIIRKLTLLIMALIPQKTINKQIDKLYQIEHNIN